MLLRASATMPPSPSVTAAATGTSPRAAAAAVSPLAGFYESQLELECLGGFGLDAKRDQRLRERLPFTKIRIRF